MALYQKVCRNLLKLIFTLTSQPGTSPVIFFPMSINCKCFFLKGQCIYFKCDLLYIFTNQNCKSCTLGSGIRGHWGGAVAVWATWGQHHAALIVNKGIKHLILEKNAYFLSSRSLFWSYCMVCKLCTLQLGLTDPSCTCSVQQDSEGKK